MTARPGVLTPGVAQGVADGIGALRLLVVLGLVVDSASTFWDLQLSDAGWSAATVKATQLVLAAAAAAAVMWLRRRLAIVLCGLVALLAVLAGPTSEELWLLVVVGVTVGARAPVRAVLAVAAAQLAFVVFFAVDVERHNRGWGLRAAAIATGLCGAGYAAGFLARRLLRVLAGRRSRVAELEQENAQIRATERLRLADDLQTVVTGGLTTIRRQLDVLAAHPDDAGRLRRGLTGIERESRAVLAELRALLEILRRDPAAAGPAQAEPEAGQPRRWVEVVTSRHVRIAAATTFALVALQTALGDGAGPLTPSTLVSLLGWTACAVVVLRARAGAAVAAVALVVSILTGTPTGWSAVPVAVVFFVAAFHAGVRRLWVVVVALLAYGAVLVSNTARWGLAVNAAAYAGALSILGGLAARHFLDARLDSVRRHARLIGDRDRLEADERTAVARELHDVVAHQLSLTALSIMSTSASTDPARLSATLLRVGESVEAAERELHALLHEMRGGAEDVHTTPLVLPSADAGTFARRLTAGGFRPVVEVDPSADELDVTTMRTLSRIMQEATTNIVRYAPPGAVCRCTLVVADAEVRLSVTNPVSGRDGRSPLSLGWGLRGIAERVELCHGRLAAGPEHGTWVVDVVLPHTVDRELVPVGGGLTAGRP